MSIKKGKTFRIAAIDRGSVLTYKTIVTIINRKKGSRPGEVGHTFQWHSYNVCICSSLLHQTFDWSTKTCSLEERKYQSDALCQFWCNFSKPFWGGHVFFKALSWVGGGRVLFHPRMTRRAIFFALRAHFPYRITAIICQTKANHTDVIFSLNIFN